MIHASTFWINFQSMLYLGTVEAVPVSANWYFPFGVFFFGRALASLQTHQQSQDCFVDYWSVDIGIGKFIHAFLTKVSNVHRNYRCIPFSPCYTWGLLRCPQFQPIIVSLWVWCLCWCFGHYKYTENIYILVWLIVVVAIWLYGNSPIHSLPIVVMCTETFSTSLQPVLYLWGWG